MKSNKNIRWGPWCLLAWLALSPPAAAMRQTCTNLVPDPGFESGGESDFYLQDAGIVLTRTAESPIDGDASIRFSTDGWGSTVWLGYDFIEGRGSRLTASAHLRSDVPSGSNLQFCAIAYYTDWSTVEECTAVAASAGDKGIVSAEVLLDETKPLMWVNARMFQEGSEPITFTLDNASVCLEVVEPPPVGGGDNGGGSGGSGGDDDGDDGGNNGGGGSDACTPSQSTVYPGFAYQLPTVRPFIPLTDFTQVSPNSTPAVRLIAAANAAVAGNPPYGYSATLSLIAYRLTNDERFLDDAIARVEEFVADFEGAIAAGQYPAIAGDSYLEIGWYLENLSIAYDHGYEYLTADQRARWAAIADQALFNLWHPGQAKWGEVPFPWTGWSVCDPGNNYHFSFLRATMLWALASQNTEMIQFLQTQKFPVVLDYYAALPGGGTREGTGYGSAIGNLFGDYLFWKTATGENLAAITPHPKETIDYWVHATVPTRNRYAPIADLSRESIPNLYDYHENMVHSAVVLSAGTPQARRGTWWLQNNSVNGVAHVFNIAGDLLPYPDAPQPPEELMYHSPGAGALFARTSWDTDATWMHVVAGKYDQSHAHHDQGSFSFFKGDFLSVTNNIWSHSGLHLEEDAHNVIRFERADGSVIPQNPSDTVASSMTPSIAGTVTTVTADLANAYSAHASLIQSWTRTFELSEDLLRITDTCAVAQGVRPIFQLQVPVAPVLQQNGSILAGNLQIVSLQPVTVTFREMNAAEFQKGYRVELTSTQGCSFNVELHAVVNPEPDPAPDPDPTPDPDPDPSTSPAPTPAPVPTSIMTATEPVEGLWGENGPAAVRVKSPAPHMHFTAGAPLRILADVRDPNAWMCPPGHPPYVCAGTLVRFYVDGQLVGSATPSATDMNLWEMRLSNGLPAGDHVLTVSYVPYSPSTGGGGTPIYGLAPVTIHVDPPPPHANIVILNENIVLDGSNDLVWIDATVVGNGFTVTAAPGYAGNVVIQNAIVVALGDYATTGIDVVTSGLIVIEGSIFEATGRMRFVTTGADSPLVVRDNELRANNQLTFVASNPDVPVVLELSGTSMAPKALLGNRVGAGIVRVRGNSWHIGGLVDGEGNVFIGPRAVLELVDVSTSLVQGNYLHHDYHGGWSQGFNLVLAGTSDHDLIEHNVIRGGSWPVQNGGGEFRYNLVVDSGHNFWRGAKNGTRIHHNVFAHANGPNTGFEGVFKFYGGESGLEIYNNTFDGSGAESGYDGPAFNLGPGTEIASIRNSLFVGFSNVSGFGGASVSAPEGVVSAPRVASADYNAWFNPLAPNLTRYLAGIVAGVPGTHDVLANPQLPGPFDVPYRISEGCIWLGTCTTGQVLAHYREIYRPAIGSPLIGAGDPADGAGTAIGAIGRDDSDPIDWFGRIRQ